MAYSFTVTNTGTTDLTGISVTDTQSAPSENANLTAVDCPNDTLAAGDQEVCTANYTVTAARLGQRSVADSATASGTPPSGPTITSGPSDYSIPATSIEIVKSADPTVVSAAGATVTYSFVVTNTGGSPLSAISVADLQGSPSDNADTSRLSRVRAPRSRRGTSRDLHRHLHRLGGRRGQWDHHRHRSSDGHPASGTPITSAPSSAVVNVAALTVVKSSSTTVITSVGQVVPYAFLVTNAGTTDLSGISVTIKQEGAHHSTGRSRRFSAHTTPRPWRPGDVHRQLHRDRGRSGQRVGGRLGDRLGHPAVGPGHHLAAVQPGHPGGGHLGGQIRRPLGGLGGRVDRHLLFLVTNTGTTELSDVSVSDTQAALSDNANLSPIDCPN